MKDAFHQRTVKSGSCVERWSDGFALVVNERAESRIALRLSLN
jgi:hypothetical protein